MNTLKTMDWALEAGLKEKPKPKRLDNIAKHMPTISDLGVGLILIFVGFTAWTGGGIGIRATADSEPAWTTLASLPKWICVFVVWFGIDSMIFKGRATPWFLRKYVQPVIVAVLEAIVGEERLESWRKKLNKKEKPEQ